MTLIKEFWHDEQGVAMAEYALLLALVAVGTIAAVTQFRDVIIRVFSRATSQIAAAR